MKFVSLALCNLLLTTAAPAQDASVTLPAAAEADHAAAMDAYTRGDYAGALADFKQAYGRLADPLADRSGRDLVLGSLRSTWARLYETGHDRVHLCDWRAALQTHTTALRQALGAAATPADTAGLERLLAEVDAQLVRDFPGAPRCEPVPEVAAAKPVPAPVVASPRPQGPPLQLHDEPGKGRRRWVAGKVLLGVGVVSLLGTTAALIVAADRRRGIQSLDESLLESGRPASAMEFERVDEFHRQGHNATVAGIVTGVVGGVAVVTAVGLLVSGRKQLRRVQAAPQVGASWGLTLHGKF